MQPLLKEPLLKIRCQLPVEIDLALENEQVRKRGLPPPLGERGQATLPDLFFVLAP